MTEQQEQYAMVATFAGKGSALFGVQFIGEIHPYQILALSEYLNVMARIQISESMQQATMEHQQDVAKPKIEVPKKDFVIPNGTLRK